MAAAAEWFGKRLKELREQAGLTQQQLAERACVGQRTVSHLEQGREPVWSTLLALSEALGVPCTAFLEKPQEQGKTPKGRPPKRSAGESEGGQAMGKGKKRGKQS